MTDPKNLNKCCPTNDGNVGKAIHSLSNRIKYLERANSDIENSLDEEKSRAIDAEDTLQQHIEEEQNRAITKEEEILSDLTDEIAARKQAINNVISSIPEAQI
jgi:prefoldin subunit 5